MLMWGWGSLIVADITMNYSSVRIVLNDQAERVTFFSSLRPFLVDLSHLVLMGDCTAVLDRKIDREREASKRSGDRSLVDLSTSPNSSIDTESIIHGRRYERGLLSDRLSG